MRGSRDWACQNSCHDDESVRKALVAALEHEGYVVDSTESGCEPIRKSHENFYNLALIDIRLPDIEGTRLLSEMTACWTSSVNLGSANIVQTRGGSKYTQRWASLKAPDMTTIGDAK